MERPGSEVVPLYERSIVRSAGGATAGLAGPTGLEPATSGVTGRRFAATGWREGDHCPILTRNGMGQTAFSFTDGTLTPGSTEVKAVHLTELRTVLDDARTSLLLPTLSYTYPGTAGTLIRAADINELRNRVK